MAEIVGLSEAVATLVHDGDCIAMEGFTHLIPFFAAGHEVIRQGRRDLTPVRLTPDVMEPTALRALQAASDPQ